MSTRRRSKHCACVISCTSSPPALNVGNSISSRPLISERHNRQTGSMFVFSSRPPLSLFTRAPRLTDRRAQVLLHTLNDGRKDRLLVVDLVGVAERRRKIPLEREAKLARAADVEGVDAVAARAPPGAEPDPRHAASLRSSIVIQRSIRREIATAHAHPAEPTASSTT